VFFTGPSGGDKSQKRKTPERALCKNWVEKRGKAEQTGNAGGSSHTTSQKGVKKSKVTTQVGGRASNNPKRTETINTQVATSADRTKGGGGSEQLFGKRVLEGTHIEKKQISKIKRKTSRGDKGTVYQTVLTEGRTASTG